MRKQWSVVGALVLTAAALTVVSAEDHHDKLPPGPIRERHELMEGIGKKAKIIGDALKSHDLSPVAAAAEAIASSASKLPALFPPGSTDPHSRAKPEIWTNRPKFDDGLKQLQANATALAAAAKSSGDVPGAAKAMFGTCKSCHEQFRIPKEGEK